MAEKFSHSICKHVIHEICSLTGFNSIKNSSSDVLADVLRSYIIKVGEASVKYAQHSGRNEPNYYDVSKSLKKEVNVDMRELYQFYQSLMSSHGSNSNSSGAASKPQSSTSLSGRELDLSVFDFNVPPFPKPVPSHLTTTARNEREHNMQSLLQYSLDEKNKRGDHDAQDDTNGKAASSTANNEEDHHQSDYEQFERLLSDNPFLPPLPPKHTFSFTPIYNKKQENSLTLQQVRTKHRRMVQTSLTRIHEADLSLKATNDPDAASSSTANATTNQPEQTSSLLYNMIVDLTDEQPTPKTTEEEDRSKTTKTNKVVNPYLVVVKQRNAQFPVEREKMKTARELNVFDVDTEEWGSSESQYEQLAKQKDQEKLVSESANTDTGKSKKKKKKQSKEDQDPDLPSFSLKRPFVATDKHDLEDLLPPNKRQRTATSDNTPNKK